MSASAADIDSLRRAIQQDGANADLYFRLGECYRQAGDFRNAVHAFEQAIAIDPDQIAAYRRGADAAIAESKKADAAGAGKVGRDLKKFAAMYLLAAGKRLHRQLLDPAEAFFTEAIALDPKCAEAFWALGAFLESRGRLSEAEKPLRRAVTLDPKLPHAYVSLGNMLQSLGRFDEMDVAYRKALALDPTLRHVRESLVTIPLMNMLYDSTATPAAIHAKHRDWGDSVATVTITKTKAAPAFVNIRDPDRRLRVAYLSPDFRYHAVSFFFAPLLANHDPQAIEVFCYAEVGNPDPVTDFLRNIGGVWRNTYGFDDDAVRAQIRTDQIDIAIDLAGHSGNNRLGVFAIKPAPVTATWLGYPATTGLSTIDWRITDARADPPGQDDFHTEKLLRLPDVFLCYMMFTTPMPDVAPVPSLAQGTITFGSFNNPQKLSTMTIEAWARILDAVPGARLMLKSVAFVEPTRRKNFLDRFAAHGVSADRLILREPQREMAAHLGSYADVDIALDPFPYNGTTTTCEAMWMGVPMISLIGDRHSGRVGFDLLSQVGLEEFALPNIDAYIQKAVELANDAARLKDLRATLRERMRASPLCDAPRFARAFETGLRDIWGEWCRS
jgi:predicted O-linked N-acetylglucosamine transferase (SPINDLY family)